MIDHSPKTPHCRLLSLMDELHRIGLEQLRFSRSYSTIYARLWMYPARSAQSHDRESGSSPVSFVFSTEFELLHDPVRPDVTISEQALHVGDTAVPLLRLMVTDAGVLDSETGHSYLLDPAQLAGISVARQRLLPA